MSSRAKRLHEKKLANFYLQNTNPTMILNIFNFLKIFNEIQKKKKTFKIF